MGTRIVGQRKVVLRQAYQHLRHILYPWNHEELDPSTQLVAPCMRCRIRPQSLWIADW